jgi:hypothetical protein
MPKWLLVKRQKQNKIIKSTQVVGLDPEPNPGWYALDADAAKS